MLLKKGANPEQDPDKRLCSSITATFARAPDSHAWQLPRLPMQETHTGKVALDFARENHCDDDQIVQLISNKVVVVNCRRATGIELDIIR